MATEAQVLANRLNAQKSTGPRTPQGKAVVSRNAVRHGLSGREAVIHGEDPGEFEFYRDRMLGELAPLGPVESTLAERVVSLSWRLQRAERLQNEAFESLYAKQLDSAFIKDEFTRRAKAAAQIQGDGEAYEGDPVIGRTVVHDFADYRILDRLLMYERRIELSLYKTMAELRRLRVQREAPAEGPVCSVPVRAYPDAGIVPVTLDHGRDTHATITPDGVTTNEDVRRRRPTYEEPPGEVLHHSTIPSFQHSISEPAATEPSCKTKPSSLTPDYGQVPAGEGVMKNSSANDPPGTNPISEAEQPESTCTLSPERYNLLRSNRIGFGVSSQG